MTEHPDSATLTNFLLGRLAPGEVTAVVAHLMHGCEHCKEEMDPLAVAILSSQGFEDVLPPVEDEAYDDAISAACRKVIEVLQEEKAAKAPGRKGALILAGFSEIPRHASAPALRPASR